MAKIKDQPNGQNSDPVLNGNGSFGGLGVPLDNVDIKN